MKSFDLAGLEKFRKSPAPPAEAEIVVSLGTCGSAAGGDAVYAAFGKEIARMNLSGVVLKKTGCLGSCCNEPNLVVRMKGLPDTIYGNVTDEMVRKILEQHVVGRILIDDQAMTMPAADIMRTEEEKDR